MEISRLRVKSKLQLLAYTTATEKPVPSHVFNLYCSSHQCQILNSLSEGRDGTCIPMDTNWLLNPQWEFLLPFFRINEHFNFFSGRSVHVLCLFFFLVLGFIYVKILTLHHIFSFTFLLLIVSSQAKRVSTSLFLFIRTQVLSGGLIPKPHLLIPSPWRLGLQYMNLGGIHSVHNRHTDS